MPLNAQQVADKEANVWAVEWGVGTDFPSVEWPADLGPLPPAFGLPSFRQALMTFPAATGLGWDDLHPRALLRLPDSLLLALIGVAGCLRAPGPLAARCGNCHRRSASQT